jgi:catalase
VADLYEQIVDTLNELSGVHPGFRAAHAKGFFLSGTFTAASGAGDLSRAAHLAGEPVRVTARFSIGGGDPTRSDANRLEGRGLAVKFHLPDGGDTDIVSLSLPVFFVRTPEDFLEFVRARIPDPETGEPDTEKLGAFLAEHPETAAALELVVPTLTPPVSYATLGYNSLHAFAFTNDGDERRFGRYRWEPEAGVATLSEEQIEAAGPDYLVEEMTERLAVGPVAFTLSVKLAADGDPLDDPTVPWPEGRETVELGRLELTRLEPDAENGDRIVVFDPIKVTDGIECSDDPILHARSKAYSVSIDRRIAAAKSG